MVSSIRRIALWAAPSLFVAVLFYWPISQIVGLGLAGDWLPVLLQPSVLGVVWFTIWQAAVSTLLCLLLGMPIAFVLYRRKFFGAKTLRGFLVIPFVLPSIVIAISLAGFRELSNNAILVILIAHLILNLSLVVRVVGSNWSSLDVETEQAAMLDGASSLKIFFTITLPALRSSIAAATSLVFLFCATSFAIVLVLGGGQVQSIETLSYVALTQFLDLQTAAALSIVQTIITTLAYFTSRRSAGMRVGDNFVSEDFANEQSVSTLKKSERPILVISLASILLFFVIPIGSVVVRAFVHAGEFGLENFVNLTTRGARDLLDIDITAAIGNSLRNAAIAAALAFAIGSLVASLLAGRRSRFAELAFLLPLGVSPVVLGFGYLISFGDGPLPLRSSWLVVPLVQALIATPLVIRMVRAALTGLGREPREAAANAGAGTWQTFWLVEAPLIRGTLVTAFGFALLASVGEFGSAALLAYGDQATLPVVLARLISRPGEQNYGMAMAASALLIALVFVLIGSSELVRSRRQRSSVVH
ncbi:MAG: hypothetical protein RL149_921 [Actinomycetota bacterium]|jgi:thiamine transport system permease protein